MNSDQSFTQRLQQAQRAVAELPEPDSVAQAHSLQLIAGDQGAHDTTRRRALLS